MNNLNNNSSCNSISECNRKRKKMKIELMSREEDPYAKSAQVLLLQSCECPHIKSYLPIQLDNCKNDLIQQYHLLSFLNSSFEETNSFLFGEEEARNDMLKNLLDVYYPLDSEGVSSWRLNKNKEEIDVDDFLKDNEQEQEQQEEVVSNASSGKIKIKKENLEVTTTNDFSSTTSPDIILSKSESKVSTIDSERSNNNVSMEQMYKKERKLQKIRDYLLKTATRSSSSSTSSSNSNSSSTNNANSNATNNFTKYLQDYMKQKSNSKQSTKQSTNQSTKQSTKQQTKSHEILQTKLFKVEEWLERYRYVRHVYWKKESITCQVSNTSSPKPPTDEYLFCLDCSFVASSKIHMSTHLFMSNHTFAVTCGIRHALYCIKCGDYIYHPLFQQETTRIDYLYTLPHYSWKTQPLCRAAKIGRFLQLDQQHVFWTGMVATYAQKDRDLFLRITNKTWHRWNTFRFYSQPQQNNLQWNEHAMELALLLSSKGKKNHFISAPVGMYNLGNTCYMSSILQCLVHCQPLQHFFLNSICHDHQVCTLLRTDYANEFLDTCNSENINSTNANAPTSKDLSCLACELDKIILQMFGSSIGYQHILDSFSSCNSSQHTNKTHSICNYKDDFGILPSDPILYYKHHFTLENEKRSTKSSSNSSVSSNTTLNSATTMHSASATEHKNDYEKGIPLIPTRLLTLAWNIDEMKHLKGYEQRDAHEFLQAFLDRLNKDLNRFNNVINSLRNSNYNTNSNFIQSLFGGTLRSVLYCEKCGCKRSQSEPYLIVSLPFRKEKLCSTNSNTEQSTSATPPNNSTCATKTRKAKGKVDIQTCLENFTAVESLTDNVHCPSCNSFSPTLQQHTFATFPKVLCLHLKRFDAVSNKKITDPVIFPAYGLDMGPYLPHWRELVMNKRQEDYNTTNNHSAPNVLYDLFGTVNHTGTLHQGHYFANVKVENKWYQCNDAFVSYSGGEHNGEKEVLESEGAYILFYIKR